ncbi:MAG: chromosome segregation protein SMC [Candidatus Eremiobacteraeota bacterium]|nr:chromosome segregation protein SMC [Candidatus Eremiobacteraeota bacterium]
MKLRRIRTFGFKTFAEPTVVEIGDGVTAIVGPNGSGKSNLVDAFRWGLGETSSKSLRGRSLEDVIFSGNEARKPLGMAEVSILFDNADRSLPIEFSEVEITRRAYRVGESEYFINRTQVRLRDILDLLMGTGLGPGSYAIVSQGQIDAILTSKPAERRALFEETAGIGKFLSRKNESMRRLDRTEQNAIRISDLISELERRIPELETQMRRARRYRRVNTRVRDLEILSYLRASATRRAECDTLRAAIAKDEELRSEAAARAASLSEELARVRTALYRSELQLEELRSKAQDERGKMAALEAQYAGALARREALERQSSQTSQDEQRVSQERATLVTEIATLEERLSPLAQEIDASRERELAATAALAHARASLEHIFTQLREVEAHVAESAARRTERRFHSENLRAEADRLEIEERSARERAEQIEIAAGGAQHRRSEAQRRLEQGEEALLDARGRAEDAEREAAVAQGEVAQALAVHRDHSVEVRAAESRLHTIEELENSLEGHVPGTRAVVEAWHRGELGGIEGIVSNLITTDERYARAMDVAFGARLSNVVTATSEDAERCVEFLNRKEAGRATFLPLDTLAKREGRELDGHLAETTGVLGYAHTLVRSDARYTGIVNFLVGNVLIVTTLEVGIELVRGRGLRDTIVTLNGEQITGGGAITGGRFVRERSILSRRFQAASLRDALLGMRGKLDEAERALQAAHLRAESAIAARDAARERQTKIESELAGLRAEAAALTAEAERGRVELDAARGIAAELRARAARSRELEREYEHDEPQSARTEEERLALERELARVRQEIASAEAAHSATSAHGTELRERSAALTAERDAARARLAMLDQDSERGGLAREEMLAHIATLMEETRTAHARIDGLRSGVNELDSQLESARAERERLALRQAQTESEQRAAEQAERDTAAGGEGHRTRLAQVEAELGMLVSQFAQNPATADECADVENRYREEDDAVVDELPRLRDELARLAANVNLNAEAERTEVADREQFLRAQMEDLAKARETLLESIREIERETQAQFNETFARVSEAFATMYARLFAGGEAKMWQTQPANLAETGIEIAVRPPGKKEMPLAALSGGERAMTAAALIFALIATKPAPFYLLDEVDAALDDANIDRFSSMVREFAADSQMLIVTHNKKTMESADRIYGVTTRDAGVSAIVSAELTREPEAMLA